MKIARYDAKRSVLSLLSRCLGPLGLLCVSVMAGATIVATETGRQTLAHLPLGSDARPDANSIVGMVMAVVRWFGSAVVKCARRVEKLDIT